MKKHFLNPLKIGLALAMTLAAGPTAPAQENLTIQKNITVMGMTKPIPVSLSGFSGEGLEVLKFDLYVQGFSFVGPDAAQFQISGSDAGATRLGLRP